MHPSYLKVSSNDDYSLDALALKPDSELPAMPDGDGYLSQAVLFGPDAAVEVRNGKLKLLMHGVVSNNLAFEQFVHQHNRAINQRVGELREHPSDVVIFIGKWYHVDYDETPFFRPYVIRIIRVDGSVEILASDKDVFWSDEENSYHTYDEIEAADFAANPAKAFLNVSERSIRRHVLQPYASGFNSFGGILWHSTIKGHPMVYVPLEGAVSHRTKWRWKSPDDLDPGYVHQFRVLDEALCVFKFCLANGLPGPRVAASFTDLENSIAVMVDHNERAEARNYVTALLGNHGLDRFTGNLVQKAFLPAAETIKFGQIPLETTARGYWVIQRDGPDSPESEPRYASFLSASHNDDLDVVLTRCAPIKIDGYGDPCTYASDWISWQHGEYRYLAFGPDRFLSWQ